MAETSGRVDGGKTGSCLCGAVRLTMRATSGAVHYCHCSQCRRQTGHVLASTRVEDCDLDVAGAEAVQWYAASAQAQRGFCRQCGSILFWKANGSSYTAVLAGSFDQPSGLRAEGHIFVADKGDYYVINDGLPQRD